MLPSPAHTPGKLFDREAREAHWLVPDHRTRRRSSRTRVLPRRHSRKPPRRAWLGAEKAGGGWNPEWSWKPGPFICMLIPRMLPLPSSPRPPPPLLLMEALSLEFGTVESLEHILAPSLQLWELPARTRGACSSELQVGLPSGSGVSPAGKPQCPARTRHHPRAKRGQSAQACPRGLWPERSGGAGDAPASVGRRELPRPSSTLTSLGDSAGVRADLCSCPSPLRLCCCLPELLTIRSPGTRLGVGFGGEVGRWPLLPSSRTLSPFGSVGARGAGFGGPACPPARTPGSLGLGTGRRLLGISRIKGGL